MALEGHTNPVPLACVYLRRRSLPNEPRLAVRGVRLPPLPQTCSLLFSAPENGFEGGDVFVKETVEALKQMWQSP